MAKNIISFVVNKSIPFRIISKVHNSFPNHYLYFLNESNEVLQKQYASIREQSDKLGP